MQENSAESSLHSRAVQQISIWLAEKKHHLRVKRGMPESSGSAWTDADGEKTAAKPAAHLR